MDSDECYLSYYRTSEQDRRNKIEKKTHRKEIENTKPRSQNNKDQWPKQFNIELNKRSSIKSANNIDQCAMENLQC